MEDELQPKFDKEFLKLLGIKFDHIDASFKTFREAIRQISISAEEKDSIEIGTAGKGGAVKVYGNFSNEEAFKAKIDKAFEIRKYASGKMLEVQ